MWLCTILMDCLFVVFDGRVMVVDWIGSCVHIFSEDGDYLEKFKLQGRCYQPTVAFHQLTEHVVIADKKEEE